MPGNQQPSSPSHAFSNNNVATKSPLVRSKSLRLPTGRPRAEPGPSTLTRHGSIRQTKAQSNNAGSVRQQAPVPVLRKPAIKPKPVFSSKSTENLVRTGNESETLKRQQIIASRTFAKENVTISRGVTFQADNHAAFGSNDAPSSLPNDLNQATRDTSWCMQPDLAVHLRRLTEEHEKLQVEYARVRMQLLDVAQLQPIAALRRDNLQHLSHSDSHLASIPENCADEQKSGLDRGVSQEALTHAYRSEICRLQEENRKLQRKYWEQVLNSESIEDEPNGGASQQVVELIDKLDDKQRELLQMSGHVQELENHLAATTLELRQCHDAINDYQLMLEDMNLRKDQFEKLWKDASGSLAQSRETVEFLQEERSTLAEALQEAEQSATLLKNEKSQSDVKLNELMTRARKLYAKVQDKNSHIQLLQVELNQTQGQARDMLLSQGAELTMMSMHLSEFSSILHSIVTGTSEFASNELGLQKEMLDDILADLDSDEELGNSPLFQKQISLDMAPVQKAPSVDNVALDDAFQQVPLSDAFKSLPNLPSAEATVLPASNGSCDGQQPSSIVQAVLHAIQSSSKNGQEAIPSHQSAVSDKNAALRCQQSSEESLPSSCSSDTNNIRRNSSGRSAFKPVGTAIPFRPVAQSNRDLMHAQPIEQPLNTEENKKNSSLEAQLNHIKTFLDRVVKIIALMKEKYLLRMASWKDEACQYQKELKHSKEAEKGSQSELNLKAKQIEKMSTELAAISAELQSAKKGSLREKEELLQQMSELKEKNRCLEAVNNEQSRQLKEEIQLIEVAIKKQNSAYFSDAVAICDKLCLRQEIVKLKESITHKEQMLQTLAQKFERTKKLLEENVQNADNEVECLDKVIQYVFQALKDKPNLVESSDILTSIYSLVSGSVTLEEIKRKERNCD